MTLYRFLRPALLAATLALPAASLVQPAAAQNRDLIASFLTGAQFDKQYRDCVARVEADPEAGRIEALRWVDFGGGEPAAYCAALADLAVDLPRVAARRLYALAEESKARDTALGVTLYAQSAQAWLLGDEPENATTTLAKAYELAPDAAELHLMAAPIYAGAGRWGDTKRVLDMAERHGPLNANGLVLRAKAKQMLADTEGAAKDVRKALNLDPDNIDALVIRGELVQAGYVIDPYLN